RPSNKKAPFRGAFLSSKVTFKAEIPDAPATEASHRLHQHASYRLCSREIRFPPLEPFHQMLAGSSPPASAPAFQQASQEASPDGHHGPADPRRHSAEFQSSLLLQPTQPALLAVPVEQWHPADQL